MEKNFARALDFEERAVYYPAVRPGYVGWANTFPYGDGRLGVAFNEIRRGANPRFKPAPLEHVEAMILPYRYLPMFYASADPDLVSEFVYLVSSDQGTTWAPTGRCPAPCRHAYHVAWPDGRMVRVWASGIWFELTNNEWSIRVEESFDGGNTWRQIARLIENSGWFPHRLKKLRDGTLITSGAVVPTFGPNGFVPQRNTEYETQREYYMPAFFASGDGGHHWTGPHYILPGTGGHEFDFVELPGSDLLFFLSTIQSNQPARQVVHRVSTGFVCDPLMGVRRGSPTDDDPDGGFTPETIVATPSGLLIGGRRCRPYVCSNDLGENWYEITDAPLAKYQPMMELLADGSVLTVGHEGADSLLGEFDMFIAAHRFRVEERLPKSTRLTLERELSADGSRYINAFRATLTSEGRPAAGRTIELRIKNTWRPWPDGRADPGRVYDSPDVRTAVTDENGTARFELADKAAINDVHHNYQLVAAFVPRADDPLAACKSPTRMAYPLTPARNDPAPYPIYNVHGTLMLTPRTAQRFPELLTLVEQFNVPNPDADFDAWARRIGSESRAREILDFLIANHILSRDERGIYRWYPAVHSGGPGRPFIHGAKICPLKEFCS